MYVRYMQERKKEKEIKMQYHSRITVQVQDYYFSD